MKAQSGTYLLVLQSLANRSLVIGRWGTLQIQPGYYLYVGSAFGPGGVRARVLRHCQQHKSRPHWHIDHLRVETIPVAVWCSYNPKRLEHDWAKGLAKRAEMLSVNGFGCTDCHCPTHLFFTAEEPALSAFAGSLDGEIGVYPITQIDG